MYQVSHLWRLSLQASTSHEDRRLQHLAKMKIERENFGLKENSVPKRISPRRVFREMVNLRSQVSPTAAKRDRNPSTSTPALVSPSKIRHKLFVDEAQKLDKGENTYSSKRCIPHLPSSLQGVGGQMGLLEQNSDSIIKHGQYVGLMQKLRLHLKYDKGVRYYLFALYQGRDW